MSTLESPTGRVWLLSPLRRALDTLRASIGHFDPREERCLDEVCINCRTAYAAYLSLVANFEGTQVTTGRALVKESTQQLWLAIKKAYDVLPEGSEHHRSVGAKIDGLKAYAREHFDIDLT